MTAPHDEPGTAPTLRPSRRSIGVARAVDPGPAAARRFAPDPRYPAMFHVAGGRLVWDGTRLHLLGPEGARARAELPAGRVAVTIGEGVVVRLHPARPTAGAPAASAPGAARAVVLDRSAERFVRFARALRDAHPGAVTIDDRTAPSPRTPRLHTAARGSDGRPGVFARTLWHARAASAPGGTAPDLVDRLERLAALHRAGDLTDAEYARAKARLLG
ncbi:SHOCT domain-containing protein [Cellulosimicrobium sp. Marseille-Q8652]